MPWLSSFNYMKTNMSRGSFRSFEKLLLRTKATLGHLEHKMVNIAFWVMCIKLWSFEYINLIKSPQMCVLFVMNSTDVLSLHSNSFLVRQFVKRCKLQNLFKKTKVWSIYKLYNLLYLSRNLLSCRNGFGIYYILGEQLYRPF